MSVPETAVDEYYRAMPGEHYVGLPSMSGRLTSFGEPEKKVLGSMQRIRTSSDRIVPKPFMQAIRVSRASSEKAELEGRASST